MANEPVHTIVVKPETFGVGYDVTIEPRPDGPSFDRECRSFAEARGYARGLRLHRGWPIRDLTGEGVE